MQTVATTQPSPAPGAILASPKPKRRPAKRALKPTPVIPGMQPSPQALLVQKVVRLALSPDLPFEFNASIRWLRRRIGALDLTLDDLTFLSGVLKSELENGPQHQPAHEAIRLSPGEARSRIVHAYGVSRETFWRACYMSFKAIICEASARRVDSASSALQRISIVLSWSGMVPATEREAVLKRLTADVRRILNDKI